MKTKSKKNKRPKECTSKDIKMSLAGNVFWVGVAIFFLCTTKLNHTIALVIYLLSMVVTCVVWLIIEKKSRHPVYKKKKRNKRYSALEKGISVGSAFGIIFGKRLYNYFYNVGGQTYDVFILVTIIFGNLLICGLFVCNIARCFVIKKWDKEHAEDVSEVNTSETCSN